MKPGDRVRYTQPFSGEKFVGTCIRVIGGIVVIHPDDSANLCSYVQYEDIELAKKLGIQLVMGERGAFYGYTENSEVIIDN
jgi:hypothetical protein